MEIGCKLDIIKGTYKARVSYAVAYQVYILIVGQVLTPFPHTFHPIPFPEPGFDPRIDIPPSPHYHHTIAQSTGQLPLGTISRPVAPGYDRHSLTGEEEKDSSHLSSLSETQERSIADKSAHVSIDQPYTLQRFYITTRSAFLADRRQLG